LKPPQTLKTEIYKKTDFVDTMSEVLRDFPLRQNQPLKSADVTSTLEF
jgi:hypothetical protein